LLIGLARTEGERKHSILWVIDQTATGPGARLLASNLHAPLLSRSEINQRLDAVEFFVQRPAVLDSMRTVLSRIRRSQAAEPSSPTITLRSAC